MNKNIARFVLDACGLRRVSPYGDILIFTVPRSGLTWLLEMFDTLPNTRCVKEPFSPARMGSMSSYFKPSRRYLDLSNCELNSIMRYLNDILNNRVLRMGYNFSSRKVKIRTNLNIIVISKLSNLAPFLADNLGCRVLYLTRHPIANALSKLRSGWLKYTAFGEAGWNQFIDIYLNSNSFRNTYLTKEQVRFAWDIRHNGSDVARFVLHWCLDNLVPMLVYREKGWPLITYEELVLQPRNSIRFLGDAFNLSKVDRMYSRITKPSVSTGYSSKETIQMIKGDNTRRQLVTKWISDVDSSELNVCGIILDIFNVDLYNCSSCYPIEEYAQVTT